MEAYHDTRPEQFEEILQNIKRLPYPKRKKFTQKEIDTDGFLERQLNDTRYLSRLAVSYLLRVCDTVRCVKGGTTAELRHQWGLNSILNSDSANIKTRDDHRHHAVDAAVVAMTTRGMLQKLSSVKYGLSKQEMPLPWPNFRKELAEAVNRINVSHRPDSRKLAGKLHEDTYYGPGHAEGTAVLRKSIDALNYGEIDNIRDEKIKNIVRNRVDACAEQQNITVKNNDNLGKILKDTIITMPSGVPIRKVRLERVENTLLPIKFDSNKRAIKFVKPGGNHHAEIFENPDGTWTGKAVSRFKAHEIYREAIKRDDYKKGQDVIINREPGNGLKFIMSLCINDMVIMTNPKTQKLELYRIQNISVSSPLLTLRYHTAARTDDKNSEEIKATRHLVATWPSFQKLNPQKVAVDLLGNIHPCND